MVDKLSFIIVDNLFGCSVSIIFHDVNFCHS